MVVPALSALLSQPAFQVLGYHCPLFVAVEIHKLYNLRNVEYGLSNCQPDSQVIYCLS